MFLSLIFMFMSYVFLCHYDPRETLFPLTVSSCIAQAQVQEFHWYGTLELELELEY